VNDFVLAREPARYASRREQALQDIATIRNLWTDGRESRTNAAGQPVQIRTFPRPISAALPLWLTAGGSDDTFINAGQLGLNVLTHLERQSIDKLTERITLYRHARRDAGHDPTTGIVTLMQHARVVRGPADVALAAEALRAYITASLELEDEVVRGGGTTSGGSPISVLHGDADDVATVIDQAVARYLDTAALIGTQEECIRRCHRLIAAGVNEVACLVDFMPTKADVLATVDDLARLAEQLPPDRLEASRSAMANAFNTLQPATP
jgi:natural product biosynthesis luciferase-like monooxygenase protein